MKNLHHVAFLLSVLCVSACGGGSDKTPSSSSSSSNSTSSSSSSSSSNSSSNGMVTPSSSSSNSSSSSSSSSSSGNLDFTINLSEGKNQYEAHCQDCHGHDGQGLFIIDSTKDIYIYDGQSRDLASYIEDFMPLNSEQNCVGECAFNIAAYIENAYSVSEGSKPPVNEETGEGYFACDQSSSPALVRPLRRLTKTELTNTYHDLLGEASPASLDNLPTDDRVSGKVEFNNSYSEFQITQLLDIARDASKIVTEPTKLASRFGGSCFLDNNGQFKDPNVIDLPPTAPPGVSNGLVAYWNFDEIVDGSLRDSATNNLHAINHGSTLSTGRFGAALSFNGSTDYVEPPNIDVPGNGFSISIWVNPSNLQNNPTCGSADCRIISKATSSNEQDHYWMLSTIRSGDDVRLRFRLKTSGNTSTLISNENGLLTENEWTHIVAVYDGSAMRLYKNNVAAGSATKSGALDTAPNVGVNIGRNPGNAYGNWEGQIDEVRIYNKGLNEEEIAELFEGAPLVEPDPDYEQPEPCMTQFLNAFGMRAYRRPLTQEEIATYSTQFNSQNEPTSYRLETIIVSLLMAQDFLFHLEKGDENVQTTDNAIQLSDYELASRISYGVLASMPDTSLFEAAQSGTLKDIDNIRAHVERLLLNPRAKEQIQTFFNFWLNTYDAPSFDLSEHFAGGISTEGGTLGKAMIEELRHFTDFVVWGDDSNAPGNYFDLMTSSAAFPTSSDLADIFDSAIWQENGSAVYAAEHYSGLITKPGFLAGGNEMTSPILRGVKMRKVLLCDELPFPDSVIIAERDDQVNLSPSEASARERTTELTKADACMSCHSKINPLGFVLEEFDALGRHRTEEAVYDVLVDGHPYLGINHVIDTQVETTFDDDTIVTINSAKQLGSAIANSEIGPACFVKQVFRFNHFRSENTEDNCHLNQLYESARNGDLLDVFINNLVTENIQWKALEE